MHKKNIILHRRNGRVVECGGLENRCSVTAEPGVRIPLSPQNKRICYCDTFLTLQCCQQGIRKGKGVVYELNSCNCRRNFDLLLFFRRDAGVVERGGLENRCSACAEPGVRIPLSPQGH